MNFFDHKDLGNHLLQLCPKVVKHSVYSRVFCSKSTDISEDPPSVSKNEPNRACYLLHAGFLLHLFFDSADGGEIFLQYSTIYAEFVILTIQKRYRLRKFAPL
jgi:hypothetical protein